MSDRFLYLDEDMIKNADDFVVRYTVPESLHYKGIRKEDVYKMAQVKRFDPGFSLIQDAFYAANRLRKAKDAQDIIETERKTYLRLKKKFEPEVQDG